MGPSGPGSRGGRPRILIADDHPGIAEMVQRLLEHTCDVIGIAADGELLLSIAETTKPDLVVVDVGLPTIDGLEACRRLTGTSAAKVIVLTASDDEGIRQRATEVGAAGFVVKYRAAEDLERTVQAALQR